MPNILLSFALFYAVLCSNSFSLLISANVGQVIPPGRYKIVAWDKLNEHTQFVIDKEKIECNDIVQTEDGQTFLQELALEKSAEVCFQRIEKFTTAEDGLIDPDNVAFYGKGKTFCDIKHQFNIHVMPVDDQLNEPMFTDEEFPLPIQTVKAAIKTKKKKANKNDCDVYYHENQQEFLDKMFKRWETNAKVRPIDVFMAKAYSNYFFWHQAEFTMLCHFVQGLSQMVECGKLTNRSQLAMAMMLQIKHFCDQDNYGKKNMDLARFKKILCAQVDKQMSNIRHDLLSKFQRWLDGELWVDDESNLMTEFDNLMVYIVDTVKNEIEIDLKTKNIMCQIGFIVSKGLAKTRIDVSQEAVLTSLSGRQSYVPDFGGIGPELLQICWMVISNEHKILRHGGNCALVWQQFCAEFIEEMWHLWFKAHGISTKAEKTKGLINEVVFQAGGPIFRDLINAFLALFNGPIHQGQGSSGITKQQLLSLYKIGNVFDRALQSDPIKALEVMHAYDIVQVINQICSKTFIDWTSPEGFSWRIICEIMKWEPWLNSTTVSDEIENDVNLIELNGDLMLLVGDVTKSTSWKELNVEDKFVLNTIGIMMFEKMMKSDEGLFLDFLEIAKKTICDICNFRPVQISGWDRICVFNMWMFKCKTADERSISVFLDYVEQAKMCFVKLHATLSSDLTMDLLDIIGKMLSTNLKNGSINMDKFKPLRDRVRRSMTSFCQIVGITERFFSSWIGGPCKALMTVDEPEGKK